MDDVGRWMIVAAGGVATVAATLGLGLRWVRRRVADVAAEREATLLASFASTGLPRRGVIVQVLLHTRDAQEGSPVVAHARHDPALGWHRPDDVLPIAGEILGWRADPFAPDQGREVEHMSDDEIGRALTAMTNEAGPSEATGPAGNAHRSR